jgi:predicted XRE-type DNA-binding protein
MSEAANASLAWAAGLFEGEGTITPKHGKGMDHRYQAAVIMTDEDVVRRFGVAVKIGKVYGPYQPTNPRAKPIWRWTTTKNSEVEELYALIGERLGERRRTRFEAAIADVRAHPAQTYFHKLSAVLHEEIRQRYAACAISQSVLAAEYGVTQSQISHIVRGRRS